MKKITAIITPLLLLALAGCATIVSDSKYPVTVDSPKDGKLTIRDDEGTRYYDGPVPTTVTLKADDGFFQSASYTARLETDSDTIIEPIQATMDSWYIGNIIFGGAIGLVIVDPASGAMWKLDNKVIIEPGPHKPQQDETSEKKKKNRTSF